MKESTLIDMVNRWENLVSNTYRRLEIESTVETMKTHSELKRNNKLNYHKNMEVNWV